MKKTLFRGLLGAALTILVCLPAASRGKGPKKTREFTDADFRTEKILEALPIRATFLDEVSWDIPHQNWGVKEWDADFKAMKQMGINTVVLIRAGLGSWIAAPFDCLLRTGKVKYPPVDLVEMFLVLSDKYGMDFWFGTYDSCYHWHVGEYEKEIELNMQLIDEVWAKYGHHKSFRGWYLSQEISRRTRNVSKIYAAMGRHAKEISGGLKTMISPYIHGVKTDQVMAGDKAITVEEHRREWDAILSDIAGAVDILAFQDGQVDTTNSTTTWWSTASWPNATAWSAGPTSNRSTATCPSVSCRSNGRNSSSSSTPHGAPGCRMSSRSNSRTS